jgi:hypothetical protein
MTIFSSCNLICIIAVGMFASMIYTMINFNNESALYKFPKSLNSSQLELYNKVVKERMSLFIQGLLLGLVGGFIYLNYSKNSSEAVEKSQCMFTVIVLGSVYLYYSIFPKKYAMLPILKDDKQRALWWDVYREMKMRCLIGFILGVVAFLMIGYVVNSN